MGALRTRPVKTPAQASQLCKVPEVPVAGRREDPASVPARTQSASVCPETQHCALVARCLTNFTHVAWE